MVRCRCRSGWGWPTSCCAGLASCIDATCCTATSKPENLHLGRDGELRLLDFGLAWCPGLSREDPHLLPGTPSYLAPECFSGTSPSVRQDLYATGVCLYQALTGRYPLWRDRSLPAPALRSPRPAQPLSPRPAGLDRRPAAARRRLRPRTALRDRRGMAALAATGRSVAGRGNPPIAGARTAADLARHRPAVPGRQPGATPGLAEGLRGTSPVRYAPARGRKTAGGPALSLQGHGDRQ